MNIVFFGSDDFASAHLDSLIQSGGNVCAIVTQPDRPKGRGMKMILSPVKELALQYKIPCFQPDKIKDEDFLENLRNCQPDVFVVIAYGKILPSVVLSIPKKFSINVHPSLLPKYRGAAPINWPIINGDFETGVSIIRLNPKMDAGDILAQSKTTISKDETSIALRQKLIQEGIRLLKKVITDIKQNTVQSIVQNENNVTKAEKLSKELGQIDWTRNANDIHNLARGLLPWPTAHTFYQEKILKIFNTTVINKDKMIHKPGSIIEIAKDGIVIACGDKALHVGQVHLADSKRMDAYAFAIGHQLEIGFQFNI